MPDPLESLSDGELSELFAREVAKTKREFLLIKRGYYYRPNAAGYTANRDEAGRFDEVYADSHVSSTHGEVIKEKCQIPSFATSADAVMPWLEKCLGWNVSKPFSESYHFVSVKTGDEDIFSWHNSTGETFARAACIALIRSARATQQDCGVRE